MNWQPIETAPRDGTAVLGYWSRPHGLADIPSDESNYGITAYLNFEWVSADDDEVFYSPPTHWMPLPEPPNEVEK